MKIPTIETERLRIRPFRSNDWTDVHAYTSNATIMHYIPEGVMTPEQTQMWVQEQAGDKPEAYAVIPKAIDKIIGHIGFHEWFHPRIYELEWILHPDYHGCGYTTEAARALLGHGFEQLGVHRVIATCQPENIASWRVMEKLTMTREGRLRQCIERPNGVWWDEYFYAILAEDWNS